VLCGGKWPNDAQAALFEQQFRRKKKWTAADDTPSCQISLTGTAANVNESNGSSGQPQSLCPTLLLRLQMLTPLPTSLPL
jgi:hypothetical protein